MTYFSLKFYTIVSKLRNLVFGSKVDKPSKFFIKKSIAAEYIESNIQNIEAPRTDDLTI